MSNTQQRRDFLKQAAAMGVGLVAGAMTNPRSLLAADAPPPPTGKTAAALVAPKLDVVRVGMVGVGGRGTGDMMQLLHCEGVQVKAVCDVVPGKVAHAQDLVVKAGQPKPEGYSNGPEDFRNLCDRNDIDIVYTATPWEWHTPICVDAMKKGKHAFTEVPACVTLDECWQMVETAEATQKHCMLLENCCYGSAELMVLNMCRQGLFGDLLHGECAYNHDLRGILFSGRGEGEWRTNHSFKRNGNLYPTHGLGPIAQYMNINRGDRFEYLVSMSSPSLGMQEYASRLKADHPLKNASFVAGDVNTSLIKTALGRTIKVQHNTTDPQPYDRINLILGTKGIFRGYPDRIYIEGKRKGEDWDDLNKFKEFEHPLAKKLEDLAKKFGGHGGMDFILNWRLVYCLRNGLPLDIDVYDTVSWSAVGPLSEKSVASRSTSVDFPDFTRGQWKTMKPLEIVS